MRRLDEAVTVYRRARDAEAQAIQAIRAQAQAEIATVRAKVDRARADLAAAIVDAARSGMRQVDIVKATGYTRERVRQICRSGGIEPDD